MNNSRIAKSEKGHTFSDLVLSDGRSRLDFPGLISQEKLHQGMHIELISQRQITDVRLLEGEEALGIWNAMWEERDGPNATLVEALRKEWMAWIGKGVVLAGEFNYDRRYFGFAEGTRPDYVIDNIMAASQRRYFDLVGKSDYPPNVVTNGLEIVELCDKHQDITDAMFRTRDVALVADRLKWITDRPTVYIAKPDGRQSIARTQVPIMIATSKSNPLINVVKPYQCLALGVRIGPDEAQRYKRT